jgi:perosamine synthetase
MQKSRIPVHEPDIGEDEVQAVAAAVRRGEISGSFGSSISDFEQKFSSFVGCSHGIAVTSGTTALHLAVSALELSPGDEVLVSASTNIATALAVFHNNAVTIPIDSEAITWNLDLDLIERQITPKTRAIIPVHLFGHPVAMDRVMEIARKHKIAVIEDCAESHGATWRGRMTGNFGDMACFSFYANKIITTGEGGMIVTNDDRLAERLRLLRNLAFIKPRFYHQVPGYNFRMTGYQAAMGLAQLAKIDRILADKRRVALTYNNLLAGIPGLQLPPELPGARNVYWMYAITIDADIFGLDRDRLAEILAAEGIETRTFFCPMNQQPFLKGQDGYREVACPVADRIWGQGLYLPSTNSLDEAAMARIAGVIRAAATR